MSKKIINNNFTCETNTVSESDNHNDETTDYAMEFFNNHHLHWNKMLNHRENIYYKYARNDHLLQLYGDCLAEEPIYIPRKFRNDNYHTTSQAEINVLTRSNLQKFQTECEVLRIRRDRIITEIVEKDDVINKFIITHSTNNQCHIQLSELYQEEINRDINKINNNWKKKIEITKNYFKNGKDKLQRNDIPTSRKIYEN